MVHAEKNKTLIKSFFPPDVSFITLRLIQQALILLNVKLCGITHKQIHIHWCLSLTQGSGGHRSPSEGLSGSVRQSVRPSPSWRLAPSLSAFNCLFNGFSSSTVALLWELYCSLASAFRVTLRISEIAAGHQHPQPASSCSSSLLVPALIGTYSSGWRVNCAFIGSYRTGRCSFDPCLL